MKGLQPPLFPYHTIFSSFPAAYAHTRPCFFLPRPSQPYGARGGHVYTYGCAKRRLSSPPDQMPSRELEEQEQRLGLKERKKRYSPIYPVPSMPRGGNQRRPANLGTRLSGASIEKATSPHIAAPASRQVPAGPIRQRDVIMQHPACRDPVEFNRHPFVIPDLLSGSIPYLVHDSSPHSAPSPLLAPRQAGPPRIAKERIPKPRRSFRDVIISMLTTRIIA